MSYNNNQEYVTDQILKPKSEKEYSIYWTLQKSMQLTCTAWEQSFNKWQVKTVTYRYGQKHESLSLHDLLPTGCHLLGV